ncbi:MAG: tetratricopeptide repeat protein [Candidatus Brocadiaceae bacterium]|nr:tetratricopeptide repeat protein [Candidatus Brocadiaceae bacterium]
MQQIIKKTLKGLTPYLSELHVTHLVRYVSILLVFTVVLHLGGDINSVCAAPVNEQSKETVNSKVNNSGSDKHKIPAVSSTPEDSSIDKKVYHFNLGVYYQKLGNIANAIKEYETVLTLDPDNAETHNNMGVIYREQNNLDKAAEHYQYVVSLNPGMEEAHNNLGVIYYIRGNFREAGAEYRKALELNPNNLKSLINIGLVYKSQGQTKKAIEVMEDVLSEDTFQAEAHYNLAILYEEMGHQEMATWHYTLFLRNADNDYSELKEIVKEHIKELRISSGSVLRG